MAAEEVSEIGWSQVVKGLVGDEEDFEMDTLFHREPVKLTEDRGDVISGRGTSEQSGSGVLYIL